MSIKEEWASNLRKHGEGFDPNWEPLPGDAVCDTQDAKGTYGIIVALIQADPLKALVLWTRELQLDPMREPTHMAQILKLNEQQMISREYALRYMGYDPNQRPDEPAEDVRSTDSHRALGDKAL